MDEVALNVSVNITEESGGAWGVVQLMGKKIVAGYLQTSEMFGAPLLRVDIPKTDTTPEYTQLFGYSALYGITLTSEEVARRVADGLHLNPIMIYSPALIPLEKLKELELETEELHAEIARLQYELAGGEPGERGGLEW